jgi:hypothetical protein
MSIQFGFTPTGQQDTMSVYVTFPRACAPAGR